jgi:hypothetical protein
MVAKWLELRCLSWSQRWALAQSLVLLPLMALGLRFFGFKRWQALLSQFAADIQSVSGEQALLIRKARSITRMVGAASRHGPYRASCLPQSLTLWWLLRRQGIVSQVRIGVRKVMGELEAHAWVEFQGQVLNDGADVHQRFAVFSQSVIPTGVSPL